MRYSKAASDGGTSGEVHDDERIVEYFRCHGVLLNRIIRPLNQRETSERSQLAEDRSNEMEREPFRFGCSTNFGNKCLKGLSLFDQCGNFIGGIAASFQQNPAVVVDACEESE